MEWISLELKRISCRHLKAFNFFLKPSFYASVCIFNNEEKKNKKQKEFLQTQKTPVDREGGRNPEWNHTMLFYLKPISLADHGDNLFLKFKLHCDGVIFGKGSVGKVYVPFKDLIDECNSPVRFVSYQIKNSDGKPNGVLNFSFKVNGEAKKIGIDYPIPVNAEAKKNGFDSPKADLTSATHYSPEKVNYPSLEDLQTGKASFYPSLDDICTPSLRTVVTAPESYYQVKPIYTMLPPPLPPQTPLLPVANGMYYHPYPSPLTITPGSYWCTTETSCGCGPHGYRGSYAVRED